MTFLLVAGGIIILLYLLGSGSSNRQSSPSGSETARGGSNEKMGAALDFETFTSDDGSVRVDPKEEGRLEVRDGKERLLFTDSYDAIPYRAGVTSKGHFVWLTTAHADTADGHQLYIYDVEGQSRVLKDDLPMRGVQDVHEDEGELIVDIEGIDCQYDPETESLTNPERVQWEIESHRLNDSAGAAAGAAKARVARLEDLTAEQVEETLQAVDQWVGEGSSDRTNARLYRRRGELLYHLRKKEKALSDYEKALSLDEKVGVKRKRKRLKKELSE